MIAVTRSNHPSRRAMLLLAGIAVLGLSLLPVAGARAATTFIVNTLNDPPAGSCAGGTGSLRHCIAAANAAGGTNTINFSVNGTIKLAAALGELHVTGSPVQTLTINGNGAANTVIDGNGANTGQRVLEIDTGATVSLAQLKITRGKGQVVALVSSGGGILAHDSALSINSVEISGNTVVGGSVNEGGGLAIGNGNLAITSSVISGNHATGGFVPEGGGFRARNGTVTISGSRIINNVVSTTINGSVGLAGGLITGNGAATITNSTISGNSALGGSVAVGGGIFVSGDLTMTGSTVSNNSATVGGVSPVAGEGGGITANGKTDVLVNDTIAGNHVAGGVFALGAGLFLDPSAGATLSMRGVTVAGNSSASGGAPGSGDGVGVHSFDTITTTARATIISGNTGGTNCKRKFTTTGSDLDSADSCGFDGATDLHNTNPLLRPLAANGGPTRTMALPSDSPAVDAAAIADCPPPSEDQRGVARPQGPRCDIGAYEYQLLVTLVNPSSGASAGGTAVTLTGIGFTGASQVTFGGRAATSFTVVNDTTITAVAPPGTGTVDVRVATPARSSDVSAADQYTYLSAVPGLPKAGAGPGR